MTPGQKKYVISLLLKARLFDDKDGVVMQHTDGRTTHLGEMTHVETQALIKALNPERTNEARDKMVRKILSQAHEMLWEHKDGKVNMKRVNDWCIKYSPCHKVLKDMSDVELAKTVTVFDKVYQSFLKGV